MEIRWRQAAAGQGWQAWEADCLRGEVLGCGGNVGTDPTRMTYWVAYVRRNRLPGQYPTLEEAKAAIEAARSDADPGRRNRTATDNGHLTVAASDRTGRVPSFRHEDRLSSCANSYGRSVCGHLAWTSSDTFHRHRSEADAILITAPRMAAPSAPAVAPMPRAARQMMAAGRVR
jgi:hypothetical protein